MKLRAASVIMILGVMLSGALTAAGQEQGATPTASPVVTGDWNMDTAAGTGFSALTPAPAGTVDIVAIGFADNNGFMPVVIHNNTDMTIGRVRVEGVVLNDNHKLIAVAGAANMTPGWIEPRGVALGAIHLEDPMILNGNTLEMLVTYDSPAERGRFGTLEPVIIEWNEVDNRFLGILSNPHAQEITDPQVKLVCLSSGGTVMYSKNVTTNDGVIPAGGTIPFQMTIDVPFCENPLIVTDGRT